MAWYEFTLKRFAYYRQRNHDEKESWLQTRIIAHRVAIAPHTKLNPLWIGKNGLEMFMPFESKQKDELGVSPEKREGHLKDYQEYLRIKRSKK